MGAKIRHVAKPARYQHQRCLDFITFSCYVVMPEHVHLVINELARGELSIVIQVLKQITSHKFRNLPPFAKIGRKGGATCE